MPSNKTTGAAPIATGVLLAGSAAREVAQHGLERWTTLALVGGLSAVAVGVGVLTGRGGFDADGSDDRRDRTTTVALAGLALASVAVGAAVALA